LLRQALLWWAGGLHPWENLLYLLELHGLGAQLVFAAAVHLVLLLYRFQH
jgi:hypothetical protein